jgi:hypothetical protein
MGGETKARKGIFLNENPVMVHVPAGVKTVVAAGRKRACLRRPCAARGFFREALRKDACEVGQFGKGRA